MLLYSLTDEEIETITSALSFRATHLKASRDADIRESADKIRELGERIAGWRKETRQDLIDYAGVIETARDEYARPSDNDLEIDDEPILSKGDDGIWVNAWVWVRTDEKDDEDDHEPDCPANDGFGCRCGE